MKKSGIDEFIELRWNKLAEPLEKYLLELAKKNPLYTNFNVNLPGVSALGVHETILISDKFGFIAWLIKNKHIKPYKAYKDFIDGDYVQFDGGECIPSVNGMLYDSILCGLAISDNPVELLIGILK